MLYPVGEHARGIYIVRFSGLLSGKSERIRGHQFRGAAARQLMRVVRPRNRRELPVNQGRAQTRYAGCILRVDQHIRLRERGCEHAMGGEKGTVTHNLKVPVDNAQIVHVV